MSDSEKADYITAVQCLQSHPSQNPSLTEAKSRFDEFQALHLLQADLVHVTVCRVRIFGPPHAAHG
jgi:tyrosinase